MFKRILITLLILLYYIVPSFAQSLDQAKQLYREGHYEEALPAFKKLIDRFPNNATYNLYYGVCLYRTNDLERSIPYLEYAEKKKASNAAQYLMDAYAKTYRFNQAEELCETYINKLKKKKKDTNTLEQQLSVFKRARRMMDRTEIIEVIDSVVISKDRFIKAYTLSSESGSLIAFNHIFKQNYPESSPVYMNQKKDRMHYARPDENNVLAIYSQVKLLDDWSDEQKLPEIINTPEGSGYPFILSDGVTIIYSSKGNESLGGYDLFRTRYSSESNSYLTPEQLSMPFNSIYNDYMLVIDEEKGLGWFVSDRYQENDNVCVYLYKIPSSTQRVSEEIDTEQKRLLASLVSIQKTWTNSEDYSSLIELAHEENQEKIANEDFVFIITDRIIYHYWEDFMNQEALETYKQYLNIQEEIKRIENALQSLYLENNASNNLIKTDIQERIKQLESTLDVLYPQTKELEKDARNKEINLLRTLQK